MKNFLRFFFIFSLFSLSLILSANVERRDVKTIGIVIIETGDEDGVWLETIKQIHILLDEGYDVKIITGKHHGVIENGYITIPGSTLESSSVKIRIEVDSRLTPREGVAKEIFEQGFEPGIRPKFVSKLQNIRMKMKLELAVSDLMGVLNRWITDESIDLLISQNANAIPMHLPLGVAIGKIVKIRKNLLSIFHNHDFFWERGDKYQGTPYESLLNAVKKYFPGKIKSTQHMVINRFNLSELSKRLGLKAIALPNVMNFSDIQFGKIDSYNIDLLENLGLPKDALLLGQVTRVVERKNIEASVELLNEIQMRRGDKRVFLIISGEESIGDKSNYKDKLKRLIVKYNLEEQVVWASDRIGPERKIQAGKKVFSLSDLYAHLSMRGMMVYPSTYEGFGNALVEAILAKVMVIANNYKVYMDEFGKYKFRTILMEGGNITKSIVDKVDKSLFHIERKIDYLDGKAGITKREYLESVNFIEQITGHNFKLGKKHLSYSKARDVLLKAIDGAIVKGNFYKKSKFNLRIKKGRFNLCHSIYNLLL